MAWHPLGWEPAFFSEIDAAPRAVLSHHYPDVPLHGDFTTIGADDYGPIDLLVGGTPCQDYSVAGLRAGLDGERGNLTLEFSHLAYRKRTRWLGWENVPGVFSSNGGRDFGAILATFSGRHGLVFAPPQGGWRNSGVVEQADAQSFGLAWRVLDAQHFGVPQRRRRVFVVGYLGDWRRAAAVLFERHSLQGHPPPRREKGQGSTGRTARSVAIRGRDGVPQAELGDEVANAILTPNGCSGELEVAACLVAKGQKCDFEVETFIAHSLRGEGFDASEDGTGRGTPIVPVAFNSREDPVSGDCFAALGSSSPQAQAVAYGIRSDAQREGSAKTPSADAGGKVRLRDPGLGISEEVSPTLDSSAPHAVAFNITPSNSNKDFNARESDRAQALTAGGNRPSARGGDLIAAAAVRRLTPRECERLQGFPDDFTLVPYRKGMMADGPRYKMLGNSMAVPVMSWVGQRIEAVEALAIQSSVKDAA